jgi:hypothetical protein
MPRSRVFVDIPRARDTLPIIGILFVDKIVLYDLKGGEPHFLLHHYLVHP